MLDIKIEIQYVVLLSRNWKTFALLTVYQHFEIDSSIDVS